MSWLWMSRWEMALRERPTCGDDRLPGLGWPPSRRDVEHAPFPQQHRLVEAIVDPLPLPETRLLEQRQQGPRADGVVPRPDDLRGAARSALVLDKVHRQVVAGPVEVPDLEDQVAFAVDIAGAVGLHLHAGPLLAIVVADRDQAPAAGA